MNRVELTALIHLLLLAPAAADSQTVIVVRLREAGTGAPASAAADIRHISCRLAGAEALVIPGTGNSSVVCRWLPPRTGDLLVRLDSSADFYPAFLHALEVGPDLTVDLVVMRRFEVSGTIYLEGSPYARYASVTCTFVHGTATQSMQADAESGTYRCRDTGASRATLSRVIIEARSTVAATQRETAPRSTVLCPPDTAAACPSSVELHVRMRLSETPSGRVGARLRFEPAPPPWPHIAIAPEAVFLSGTVSQAGTLYGGSIGAHLSVPGIGRLAAEAALLGVGDSSQYAASLSILPATRLHKDDTYVLDVALEVGAGVAVMRIDSETHQAPLARIGLRIERRWDRRMLFVRAAYAALLDPEASQPGGFFTLGAGISFRIGR